MSEFMANNWEWFCLGASIVLLIGWVAWDLQHSPTLCEDCENCQRMDCDEMLDFDEVELEDTVDV